MGSAERLLYAVAGEARSKKLVGRGYIYIIDPHLTINGQNVLKIGFTTRRPSRRLKELQTSLPHSISMIHIAEFPNARMAEAWLHRSLSSRKVNAGGGTEFFSISRQEAIALVSNLSYRVSKVEAEKALERDLFKFRDAISGRLSEKCGFVAAALGGLGPVVLLVFSEPKIGLGEIIAFAVFGGLPFALVSSFFGFAAGNIAAKLIWRSEIASERIRLLENYPAARDGNQSL